MVRSLYNPHTLKGKFVDGNYLLAVAYRTEMTIRAAPKFFFGAFFFQAFCYIASDMGLSDVSAGYYFMAGLGDFIGVLFSFLIVTVIFYKPEDYYGEFEYSILSALSGGLATGTIWQLMVNLSQFDGMGYTEAFFLVYIVSFTTSLASTMLLRTINEALPPDIKFGWDSRNQALWHDILVSVVVGAGDAFFTGTSATTYDDNWLAPIFGVYSYTNPFVGMGLAGASSLTGYAIAQFVLNLIVFDNWTDPGEDEVLFVGRLESIVNASRKTGDGGTLSALEEAEDLLFFDKQHLMGGRSNNNNDDEVQLLVEKGAATSSGRYTF